MHYKIQQNKITKILNQRNISLFIIAGLILIILGQVLLSYKLINNKKINFIPLPPVLSAPFSVSKNNISAGYLADMSRYFAMLRLNSNPNSFEYQKNILLNYIDAKFYAEFKRELNLEEKSAKENDISISFIPIETKVFAENLSVLITGDLIRYIGKTKLDTQRITYKINFKYNYGILKIIAMLKADDKDV